MRRFFPGTPAASVPPASRRGGRDPTCSQERPAARCQRQRRSAVAFDPQLQRRIFGRFATGVTVVTTRHGEQLHGMTANAVTSLSLDPPLVLVAVDRRAGMHAALHKGQCFALNILNDTHEHLSRRFASSGPKEFGDLAITTAITGAPILKERWGGSIAASPRCWPAAITTSSSARSWPAATTRKAGRCSILAASTARSRSEDPLTPKPLPPTGFRRSTAGEVYPIWFVEGDAAASAVAGGALLRPGRCAASLCRRSTITRICSSCLPGTNPLSSTMASCVIRQGQEQLATAALLSPVLGCPPLSQGSITQSSGSGLGNVPVTATPTNGAPGRISSVAVTMTHGRTLGLRPWGSGTRTRTIRPRAAPARPDSILPIQTGSHLRDANSAAALATRRRRGAFRWKAGIRPRAWPRHRRWPKATS